MSFGNFGKLITNYFALLLLINRFFIHDADKEKELLLGHVSMILDMVRIIFIN